MVSFVSVQRQYVRYDKVKNDRQRAATAMPQVYLRCISLLYLSSKTTRSRFIHLKMLVSSLSLYHVRINFFFALDLYACCYVKFKITLYKLLAR